METRPGLFLLALFAAVQVHAAKSEKSPGGLRFLPEKPGAAWPAGSKQNLKIDGPATNGSDKMYYRWVGDGGHIYQYGFLFKAGNSFAGQIKVPRFANKGIPKLVLEIGKKQTRETWIFRGGREFDAPKIVGLVIDKEAPYVYRQARSKTRSGERVDLFVYEKSGVGQTLVISGAGKSSAAIPGECQKRGKKDQFICSYFLNEKQAKAKSVAQLSDLAGNRTVASVAKGGE